MTRLSPLPVLFLSALLPAAGADLAFSTYLGSARMDSATGVAVDRNGYIYVAGWTETTTGVDATVTKLSPDGKTATWRKTLGGRWEDRATAIALDASGNIYVAGWTSSPDFPVTGAYQTVKSSGRDAFLAKLSTSGTVVLSTFFGGTQHDAANGISLDTAGNIYIAGETMSPDLPVRSPWQGGNRGGSDGFVAKFSPTGSPLYATYIGGSLDDCARAIAVDTAGNAYLTGETSSFNFPALGGVQPSSAGGQDAFVLKLDAAGVLMYSTYLGGSGGVTGLPESGAAIVVDAAGNAYVAGTTSSGNFPVVNAMQPRPAGGITDTFVAKLNSSGSGLIYSTYLGGSSVDYASAIAVDGTGSAWVAGYTASTNLAMKAPIQSANAGSHDAFAAQLSPDGQAIVQSTYFGGLAADASNAIALTGEGTYIAGQTASTNFPVKNAAQPTPAGMFDGFVLRLGLPPKYEGIVDAAACDAIIGWGWNANSPFVPVEVGLYADSVLLSTLTADWLRQDLVAAGIGNGAHGFYIPVPLGLKDGIPHLIDVRLTANDMSVSRSPQSLTCTGPEGVDDAVNCSSFAGWAWDRSNPSSTVSVDVYDGTKLLMALASNGYRPDLAFAGIGNGNHGYYLPLPTALADGKPHVISMRISGTSVALSNTGRTITCTGPEGVDDTANCIYLAGWAWDRRNPAATLDVDVFDGATRIATIPANWQRADLQAAGIGDGRHGYYYDTPASLRDGRPHTISVRIRDTGINLGNTGRTLTCSPPK